MKNYFKNPRLVWVAMIFGFAFVLVSLIQINSMVNSLRTQEKKQVEIWAKAISKKADMVKQTNDFYGRTLAEEKRKMQQFVEAYKIIMSQSEDAELSSSELKFYTNIIMDNKNIPVIITDEFNNIQFSQNIDIPENQHVLVGDLYKKFSSNPPFEYEVYGMKFRLYYTESEIYASLKVIVDEVVTSFLSELTDNSISVPVVITDSSKTKVLAYGNIDTNLIDTQNLKRTISSMASINTPIKISLPTTQDGYIFYERGTNITLLQYYPYLYLFVFVLFGLLLFWSFRAMKVSEQNYVWVGMSKETAHQLGTPISSLLAWIELLKQNPENTLACEEMDKDIDRLNIVSQRFSQIGSMPKLKDMNILDVILSAVEYVKRRSSKNIQFEVHLPQNKEVNLPCNQALIEWSFENIFKNAIDAMDGSGTISVNFIEEAKSVNIEISDTGKGMPKRNFKKIFEPGFTTKQRGWGLGLSLVRRIVQDYHKGKVYVKSSIIGRGTVFCIELKK